MSQISACFNKVKKPCYRFISTQEISTEKFKNKDKMLRSFLIPVCFWIAKEVKKNKTMILVYRVVKELVKQQSLQ